MANEMMLKEELSLMNTLLETRKALSKEDQKILSGLKQINRTSVNIKINSTALTELRTELSSINYELQALSQPKQLKPVTSGLELVKKYTGDASKNLSQFEKSLTNTNRTAGDLSSSVKILKEYDFGIGESSSGSKKSSSGSMKEAKGYFLGLGADVAILALENADLESEVTSILADTINGAIAGAALGVGVPGAIIGASVGLLLGAIKTELQKEQEEKKMYSGVVQSMFQDVYSYGSDLLLEPILNFAQKEFEDAKDESIRLNTFLGKYQEVETMKTDLMDYAAEQYMEVRSKGLEREKQHYEENAMQYRELYGVMAAAQAHYENDEVYAYLDSQEKFLADNMEMVELAGMFMSDEQPSLMTGSFMNPIYAFSDEQRKKIVTSIGMRITSEHEIATREGTLATEQSHSHQVAHEVNKGIIEGQKELVIEYKDVIDSMRSLQQELTTFKNSLYYDAEYWDGYVEAHENNLAVGRYQDAYGLQYVPYNNFPALLHEGERVLTASEARSYNNPLMPVISGNTFVVRQEQDIDKIAETLAVKLKTAAMISA